MLSRSAALFFKKTTSLTNGFENRWEKGKAVGWCAQGKRRQGARQVHFFSITVQGPHTLEIARRLSRACVLFVLSPYFLFP